MQSYLFDDGPVPPAIEVEKGNRIENLIFFVIQSPGKVKHKQKLKIIIILFRWKATFLTMALYHLLSR